MNLIAATSLLFTLLSTAFAQLFPAFDLAPPPLNPTPNFIPQPIVRSDYTHPEVLANSIAESQLPPEMLNDFYKNPAIANMLAKESWFGNKETPVFDRETAKISRSEIYKIFRRAGWIRRR